MHDKHQVEEVKLFLEFQLPHQESGNDGKRQETQIKLLKLQTSFGLQL